MLKDQEEVEKHFIENYSNTLITVGKNFTMPGNIEGGKLSPGLLSLLKESSFHAKKHPASLVNPLCTILGNEGLKFFKRGKKIFACITRPKPLSEDDTLSKPIKAIVTLIRERKRVTSKELLGELAPSSQENVNEKDSAESNTTNDLGTEQMRVLQDLNWLLREGAVIAFGDGKIELATSKKSNSSNKTNEQGLKSDK